MSDPSAEDKLTVPKGFKEPKFTPEDNPHSFLEESKFKIIFPKYREKQIKEAWPLVENFLKDPYHINCELDLVENTMTVMTTKKTWDPWAIINARDMIKCLSRSVPFEQSIKVFEDEIGAQFMKIDGMVRNKKKFRKRRDRLIGPDSATLKALEVLTGCYILVAGKTVSSIGPYKGLREVFKFVTNTMNNIHPVYMIKEMMIKRELSKDPKMESENWSRFLPNFKTDRSNRKTKSSSAGQEDNNNKTKAKSARKQTNESKSPFVPKNHFTASKIDKQLESGEYFMKQEDKKKRKMVDKEKQNRENSKAKKMKKMEDMYTAPDEGKIKKAKEKKVKEGESVDLKKLKKKLGEGQKKKKKEKKSLEV